MEAVSLLQSTMQQERMLEGWSELTTIQTQKYVIINLKVVVIQQLGNYFDDHRHPMHWLHSHQYCIFFQSILCSNQ